MPRLKAVTHSINGGMPVTLLSNIYIKLGELIKKNLANGLEDIDYSYTIRAWLTRINKLTDGTQKFL